MFRTLLFPIGLLLSPPHCPKPNHRSPVLPSQSKWYCPSINKIWKNGGKVRGKNKKRAQKPATSWHLWADQWFQRCRQACMAGLSPVQDIMYFSSANFIRNFFLFADSIMNIMRTTHTVQVMNIMLIKRSALYIWFHHFLRNLIVSCVKSNVTSEPWLSNQLWKQDTVWLISRNKYIATWADNLSSRMSSPKLLKTFLKRFSFFQLKPSQSDEIAPG